jgi:fructose-1,6-bisphosphatase/inositol monophosphatase family enzyme
MARFKQKTSAADLVTEADVSAERVITDALLDRFDGAVVIGEEAVSENPALLDGWSRAEGPVFVVDPIDGTFNFASGVASFGVMLAVVEAGETVAGIIHDPVCKDWIMAEKGSGAILRRLDGRETALKVAEPAGAVNRMIGSASWQYMPEPERSTVARNQALCLGSVAYRCAAQEYRLLGRRAISFCALPQADALGPSGRQPDHQRGGRLYPPFRWQRLSARTYRWRRACDHRHRQLAMLRDGAGEALWRV